MNHNSYEELKLKHNIFCLEYLETSQKISVIVVTTIFYAIAICSIFYTLNYVESTFVHIMTAAFSVCTTISVLCVILNKKGFFFYNPVLMILTYYVSGFIFLVMFGVCCLIFLWFSPFFGSEYKIITVTDKFLANAYGTLKSIIFILISCLWLKFTIYPIREVNKENETFENIYKLHKQYKKSKASVTFYEYLNTNTSR